MTFYHLTISLTLILVNILPVLNFINRLLMGRRYDLDWSRGYAFAALIFYHIGMLNLADRGFHYKC
jgi:hypothetical protein